MISKKFEKVKRSDIIDTIIDIEKKLNDEVNSVEERNSDIEELKQKGREMADRVVKLSLAKKIERLLYENRCSAYRINYLNANLSVLAQLKNAFDDKVFISSNTKMPINEMLADAASLKKFLTNVNTKKLIGESNMLQTLETFQKAQNIYEKSESLSPSNIDEQNLLALFDETSELDELDLLDKEIGSISQFKNTII